MLTTIAWIAVISGLSTAGVIAADVVKRPQHMAIMNVTWPITGLYFPIVGWWIYSAMGRPDGMPRAAQTHHGGGGHQHHHAPKPKWQSVFVGVTHCGGGCTLGDSVAAPIVAALGLTLAGSALAAHYTGEFIAAYLFGIAFQFLPIMEMGETRVSRALVNAVKADTLSLVAFEIGMFGFMSLAVFVLVPTMQPVASPVYWFMMQIAMVAGFATAYPANWWLVNRGIKHGM